MSGGYGNKFKNSTLLQNSKLLRFCFKLIYPPMPTINCIEKKQLKQIQYQIFKNNNVILNYGCGISTGSGKRLWDKKCFENSKIIHFDILQQDEVLVVGDAHKLPFKSQVFDSIICQAVLEHVSNPKKAVNEMFRVLKPKGHVFVEVPFIQGYHADPHDYQRYTLNGLQYLFKNFKILDCGVSVGPFCSLVWILRDGLSSFFHNKFMYFLVRFFVSWFLSPLRYLDFFIRKRPLFKKLACENFIFVKKNNIKDIKK